MGIEDDCVCSSPKVFVGQISVDVDRSSVLSTFASFGSVLRIDMLTPRQLNTSTRSAMVWFDNWIDVERVLDAAEDDRIRLGDAKKLVVRIADPPKRGDQSVGIKPRKLFVGQIPHEVKESEVQRLFEQFGSIEEFEFPKRLSGNAIDAIDVTFGLVVSCAFVRYRRWSQAESAIRNLNEIYRFPQSKRPLVVKYADAKMSETIKSIPSIGEKRPLSPEDRSTFLKRPSGLTLEGERGGVHPLDLGYVPSRMGAPMGTGSLIGMGRKDWTAAELRCKGFLNIMETTPASDAVSGSSSFCLPMDLDCMKVEPLIKSIDLWPTETSLDIPIGPNGKLGKGFSDPRVKDWTLFVGQIPHQADEYALWDIFRPFGEILELNILRKEGRHRGCAFVTYTTKEMGMAAIDRLNDASFPWDANRRKLVVRFREKSTKH